MRQGRLLLAQDSRICDVIMVLFCFYVIIMCYYVVVMVDISILVLC